MRSHPTLAHPITGSDPIVTDETDIRAQIAALLAGDLDEPAAGALQARIDAEPWVGRLADEMADLLVTLGRVDLVEPPAGLGDRLRAGIAAEIGRPLAPLPPAATPDQRVLASSGAAAATGWAEHGPPGHRDDGRPGPGGQSSRRAPRRARLRGLLGAAAVIAVLAVAGVGVLTRTGSIDTADSSDSAEFAAGDADSAEDAALQEGAEAVQSASAADDAATFDSDAAGGVAAADTAGATDEAREEEASVLADEGAAEDTTAVAPAPAAGDQGTEAPGTQPTTPAPAPSPAEGPAVLVLGALDGSDAAIAGALADQPAVQALRGTPAADAVEVAAAYRDELIRGADFPDGTVAATCLADTLAAAGADLVPAVAARLDLPDGPAVAYALVRSTDGATLDAVDVWVLDLPACEIDRVVQTR